VLLERHLDSALGLTNFEENRMPYIPKIPQFFSLVCSLITFRRHTPYSLHLQCIVHRPKTLTNVCKKYVYINNQLLCFMGIFPATFPNTVGCVYAYQERPFRGTEKESGRVDEGCARTTQSGQDEEEQRKARAQWERRLWLLS